jgi:hypothetical protein
MSSHSLIYNVDQDHYAFSSNGQLASIGASRCIIIIIIFNDDSVMLEHRSDTDLCATGQWRSQEISEGVAVTVGKRSSTPIRDNATTFYNVFPEKK